MNLPTPDRRQPLRFDRNELSGAFGDLGTDLPLIVGMVTASGLDAASVLILFGAMQVFTGVVYRMPMPVQPLKAVAAIVIAQRLAPEVIFGGGLAIGLLMLGLALSGLLGWLARVVPRVVVRGLQFGLGLQLALLALREYVPSLGAPGYALAIASFTIVVLLLGNRRMPPAPVVIALGVGYALLFTVSPRTIAAGAGFALPGIHLPAWSDVVAGFLLLALPQIPLSLGNSVLATRQVAADLFPERAPLTVRRIGVTYGIMNVVAPFLGGIPTCHGSGGMAGHYALGGRTGGSVVIYGAMYLLLGTTLSGAFESVVQVFPRPMLGVLLLVEGVALVVLLRDLVPARGGAPQELALAMLVGLVAVGLPYGYLVGLVLGVVLAALLERGRIALEAHGIGESPPRD